MLNYPPERDVSVKAHRDGLVELQRLLVEIDALAKSRDTELWDGHWGDIEAVRDAAQALEATSVELFRSVSEVTTGLRGILVQARWIKAQEDATSASELAQIQRAGPDRSVLHVLSRAYHLPHAQEW